MLAHKANVYIQRISPIGQKEAPIQSLNETKDRKLNQSINHFVVVDTLYLQE